MRMFMSLPVALRPESIQGLPGVSVPHKTSRSLGEE